MTGLTIQLHGNEAVTLDDMGEGFFVLSRTNEAGDTERFPLEWSHILDAVKALAPRYGDPKTQIAA
jgi:hypothetical protein